MIKSSAGSCSNDCPWESTKWIGFALLGMRNLHGSIFSYMANGVEQVIGIICSHVFRIGGLLLQDLVYRRLAISQFNKELVVLWVFGCAGKNQQRTFWCSDASAVPTASSTGLGTRSTLTSFYGWETTTWRIGIIGTIGFCKYFKFH